MTKREVMGRYRGSLLGLAWSFFNPIFMLVIYTFVFSVVFKARWGIGEDNSETSFAIVLFVGLMVHGLFAECIGRAPNLILSNESYVKKVVFPLEILPWVALGSASFHILISLLVLLAAVFILGFHVPWTALLFPVVILPFLAMTLGVAWFMSATGVFLRDIGQTTGLLITTLLFLSPAFYSRQALPEEYQDVLLLNPLTFIIEEARQVLLFGNVTDWSGWTIYSLISVMIAWVGFWWFQKTRKGFADVI